MVLIKSLFMLRKKLYSIPIFLQDALETSPNQEILNKMTISPLYFTRTRGLFRECFPGEKTNAPIDKEISKCCVRF